MPRKKRKPQRDPDPSEPPTKRHASANSVRIPKRPPQDPLRQRHLPTASFDRDYPPIARLYSTTDAPLFVGVSQGTTPSFRLYPVSSTPKDQIDIYEARATRRTQLEQDRLQTQGRILGGVFQNADDGASCPFRFQLWEPLLSNLEGSNLDLYGELLTNGALLLDKEPDWSSVHHDRKLLWDDTGRLKPEDFFVSVLRNSLPTHVPYHQHSLLFRTSRTQISSFHDETLMTSFLRLQRFIESRQEPTNGRFVTTRQRVFPFPSHPSRSRGEEIEIELMYRMVLLWVTPDMLRRIGRRERVTERGWSDVMDEPSALFLLVVKRWWRDEEVEERSGGARKRSRSRQ